MTTAPRPLIPALARVTDRLSPYAYPLMRVATGAILLPHGVQKLLTGSITRTAAGITAKGLPLGELLAYLTFATESAAALCLAIGLFTRLAAAMIGVQMLVIVCFFQWHNGYFWTKGGYEYPLLWALLCLAIFLRGGGRCAVDNLIGREI